MATGQRFTHITTAYRHITSRHCAEKPLAMAVKRALNLTDPAMQPRYISAYSTFASMDAYDTCRTRAIQLLQLPTYQDMAQVLRTNPEQALNIKIRTDKPIGYVVTKRHGKLRACTTNETRVVVDGPQRPDRQLAAHPVAEGHDLKPIPARDLTREVHNLPEYQNIARHNPLHAIALNSSVDNRLPALAYDPKTKTLACPIELQPGAYLDTLHFNAHQVYIAHNDGSVTRGAEAIKQNADAMRVLAKIAPLIEQIRQTVPRADVVPTTPSPTPQTESPSLSGL